MAIKRENLLGLTPAELSAYAIVIGEPKYRGGQLSKWIYAKGVTTFSAMTDLGKDLRDHLEERAIIKGISLASHQSSARDGTTKYLFALPDGLKVESVLIPLRNPSVEEQAEEEREEGRRTLCVSTQVGCPLDCVFCATGTMGYRRNLTAGEIVDQLLSVRRLTGQRISNVVFMGMGEPLLNYESVLAAAEIMVDGIKIAARRITISTAGRPDRIRQLADEGRQMKLAVSLHSAVDETRARLMPISQKFGLRELLDAVQYYYRKTKQRVTYEVIFFDGVNDAASDVRRLIQFVRQVPSKINVIPFHSINFTAPKGFAASLAPSPKVSRILNELRAANLTVTVRASSGEDIDAACGQLATRESTGLSTGSRRPNREIAA